MSDKPVAYMHTTATGVRYFRKKPQDKVFNPQPVYTHPPQDTALREAAQEALDALVRSDRISGWPNNTKTVERLQAALGDKK